MMRRGMTRTAGTAATGNNVTRAMVDRVRQHLEDNVELTVVPEEGFCEDRLVLTLRGTFNSFYCKNDTIFLTIDSGDNIQSLSVHARSFERVGSRFIIQGAAQKVLLQF